MFQLLLPMIYLAFISLGLPDALLGAAWPTIYGEFSVPVSYAGIISMIIAVGTVLSSLQSDRLTKKIGTGRTTACSVLLTAVALAGFSVSHSFVMLCFCAIPYGLGAGSVDASINNYVALHYASRHMSWLHCMWGVGAALGPYIMGIVLAGGNSWNLGYRYIAIFQVILTAILFLSLPLWKKSTSPHYDVSPEKGSGNASERQYENPTEKPLSLRQIAAIPGTREIMATFFCYCAIEQTTGLWASSYLVLFRGLSSETAASFAGLFFIGITVGRAASGFMTIKWNDTQMIRFGQVTLLTGIIALLLPSTDSLSLLGFILIGLGCAPVYPCLIHSTPKHFGASRSQAIIGVQMASAYVGTCLMPPIFGVIANYIHVALLPGYLLFLLALMAWMYERLLKKANETACSSKKLP